MQYLKSEHLCLLVSNSTAIRSIVNKPRYLCCLITISDIIKVFEKFQSAEAWYRKMDIIELKMSLHPNKKNIDSA